MDAGQHGLRLRDLRSTSFACTYAAPGPCCSRMFAMSAGMAPVLGVAFVMRDVTLWAFTIASFEQRGEELAEFETAMSNLDQPVHAYLAVIKPHDTTAPWATRPAAARGLRPHAAYPRRRPG